MSSENDKRNTPDTDQNPETETPTPVDSEPGDELDPSFSEDVEKLEPAKKVMGRTEDDKYTYTVVRKRKKAALSRAEKRLIALFACIIAVIIAAGSLTIAFAPKLFANSAALKVGSYKVPLSEMTFNYQSNIEYFYQNYYDYLDTVGFNIDKPLGSQTCYFDKTMSWRDYFINEAADSLRAITVLARMAEAEGITLSEYSQKQIDNYYSEFVAYYSNETGLDEAGFIKALYGRSCSAASIHKALENTYLAQQYVDTLYDRFTFSQEEVDAYISEHISDFLGASYNMYTFDVLYTDDSEYIVSLKDDAETFLKGVTDSASFDTQAYAYAAEADKETYAKAGATLTKFAFVSEITDTLISDWLFDEDRQVGDKTVIYSSVNSKVYAILFNGTSYDTTPTVNLRSIYIGSGTESNATMEDALATAQSLYDQFIASGKDTAVFADLALQYSEDSTSKYDGGLYQSLTTEDMTDTTLYWCYATEYDRQAGDCEVVQSDNGYFVLYLESYSEIHEYAMARKALQDNAYTEWLGENLENVTAKVTFLGEWLIGKN